MAHFSLATFPIQQKTVLLRVDFNVPLEKKRILDNTKIKLAFPTINYLLAQQCKIVLATHLGRPSGKIVDDLKVKPLAEELARLLPNTSVHYLKDCIGREIRKKIQEGNKREIFVLENLRFYKEEEENDLSFAHSLAELAEVYVNDAFATYHPAASISAITRFLPAISGLLMEKEILNLKKGSDPKRPSVWLLGGGKLDKISIVPAALKKVDYLLLGGALPFSVLKAQGISVGMSKVDYKMVHLARRLLKKRIAKKIILPLDFIVAENFSYHSKTFRVPYNKIPSNCIALDLGPETIRLYKHYLRKAKTIVWNGPLGYFEWAKFAAATREIGKFLGSLTATTLCGGGETEQAIRKFHLEHGLTHVSTGGGAALEFLTGKKLPSILALEKNYLQFKRKVKIISPPQFP